jgi:hypothetical protein
LILIKGFNHSFFLSETFAPFDSHSLNAYSNLHPLILKKGFSYSSQAKPQGFDSVFFRAEPVISGFFKLPWHFLHIVTDFPSNRCTVGRRRRRRNSLCPPDLKGHYN